MQEVVTKSIPKKNKCKARWLSEQALQIPVNGKEEKGKEKEKRYPQLNAEF